MTLDKYMIILRKQVDRLERKWRAAAAYNDSVPAEMSEAEWGELYLAAVTFEE